MPVRAQLFDGTILEFPDGTPTAVISRVAKEQTAQRKTAGEEPGFFDIAQSYTTDIPVRAIKGALGGVESITNIFGADNAVSELLEGAQEGINEYLVSDTAKRRAAEREQALEGKGFVETLKEVPGILLKDPALIFEVLGSAAPAVAATALTGGAGAVPAAAAALGTGAAMGVGATKESIYDATKEEFIKAGADEAAAEAAADEAQSYLGKNTDMIALGGALGALASRTGLEPTAARMLAGRVLGKSVSQAAGREAIEAALQSAAKKGAIRTGLTEAGTESAQGAQEALAGNLARKREGFDVDVTEGVGQAAALEGTLGGIAGAGVGVLGKSDAVRTAMEQEAALEAQERAERPVFGAPEEFNRKNISDALDRAVKDAPFEAQAETKKLKLKLNNDINTGTPEAIAESEAYVQSIADRVSAGEITKASIEPLESSIAEARNILESYKQNVLGAAEPVQPAPEVDVDAELGGTAAPVEPAAPVEAAAPVETAPSDFGLQVPLSTPVVANAPLPVRNAAEFKGASRAAVTMSNAFENAGPIDETLRAATGLDQLPEGLSLQAVMEPLKAKQSGVGKLLERSYVTPITNYIKNSGLQLQDVGLYLLARAAPARNAVVRERNPDFPEAGSGMDDAEAAEILEDLEARGLMPKLNRLATMHDKFVDDLLMMRVDAGLLPSEDAVALRRAEPMYTPFKGFSAENDLTADIQEDKDAQVEALRTARGNMRTKEFMQARGRESLPYHPLFNLIADAEALSRRMAINEASNTVLNMVESAPEVMSQFIKATYTDMQPKVERRMGQMIPVDMAKEVSRNPNQYMVVKRGGETKYLEYNTNTDGGKALQEMFMALTPEQLGGAMKVWSGVNNALKSLLTYRNPLYLAGVAPLRDITDAVATAFAAQNIKGSPAFKKSIGLKTLGYTMPGSGTWGLITRFVNDKPAKPGQEADIQLIERMLAAGGAPMQLMFQTTEERGSKMKAELERYAAMQKGSLTAATKERGAALLGVLDAWADINDLVPRFATFKAAVEAGLTDAQAAALSLDSSLNLTKRGTMTRWTDNIAPFFSAGVEGSRKFIRIMTNPRAMTKVAGTMIALGIIESLMNAANSDDENDDGTPDYLDVSKGTRMSRMVFFYGSGGDDHVDIPIGHMLGYMKYIGNQLADTAMGISTTENAAAAITGAGWDLTTGLFSLLSPARVQGGDLATSLTSLAPLGIKPFVEAVNNKNFFGTPIYTEHRENSGPASELGRMTTAEGWKSLARGINDISGGSPATSGYVDFQPEVYEHIIDNLLGGAYDLLTQANKSIEEPKAENIPVIRGFVGKGFDYVPQTKYKENTKTLAQWKSRIDNLTPEQMQRELLRKPIDADPRVVEAFNIVEKEVSRLQRERKELEPLAKTEAEKRAVQDYYRAEMNTYQNKFNRIYDTVRKEKQNAQ